MITLACLVDDFPRDLIARVEEGLGKEERKRGREKKLLARHTQWNVYVWNDAPRAVKDMFSETPVNRTDYKRCLFALHYITLHYVTLHYITFNYITLHYMLPV